MVWIIYLQAKGIVLIMKCVSEKGPKPVSESISHIKRNLLANSPGMLGVFPTGLLNVSQYDPNLINEIRNNWIIQPSHGPLNLTHPGRMDYSQHNQSQRIDTILGHRKGGFYVECGAADGEYLSNTLYLEKFRQWTGLLVEADPGAFKEMVYRQRHAYLLNTCISPLPKPITLTFQTDGDVLGGLTDFLPSGRRNRKHKTVQLICFPLYSVLQAIGVNHVDYFSLDVEGPEVDILRTIPFDKITIDTLTVEYYTANSRITTEKLLQIRQLVNNLTMEYEEEKTNYSWLDLTLKRLT